GLRAGGDDPAGGAVRVHGVQRESCERKLVIATRVEHASYGERYGVIEHPDDRIGAAVEGLLECRRARARVVRGIDLKRSGACVPGDVRELQLADAVGG